MSGHSLDQTSVGKQKLFSRHSLLRDFWLARWVEVTPGHLLSFLLFQPFLGEFVAFVLDTCHRHGHRLGLDSSALRDLRAVPLTGTE